MITISPTTEDIIFSSELSDIIVTLTQQSAYVDIYVDDRLIHSEEYFPYGQQFDVLDVSSLIEQTMRRQAKQFATVKVTIDAGSEKQERTYKVLYCSKHNLSQTSAAQFAQASFLTLCQYRRIPPDGFISVSAFLRKGESTAYTVKFTGEIISTGQNYYGSYQINAGQTIAADGIMAISLTQNMLMTHYPGDNSDFRLRMFSILLGNRSVHYFIDPDLELEAEPFAFRSSFNALEQLWVPGQSTMKTTLDSATAMLRGVPSLYNRRISREFEIKTGALTSDECQYIDELMTSEEIYRMQPKGRLWENFLMLPAVITEFKCQIDKKDFLNTVTFTWRYTEPRVAFFASEFAGGIFTLEYDENFN